MLDSSYPRFVVPALLFLSVAIAAPTTARQSASAAIVASPASARQIHDDLQAMDRRLRLRLLRLADERPAATVSEDEIQRLRCHLRSLEARLHATNGDEAAVLIRKVRALRPLVDNLERTAERPETAPAGLAEQRKALRAEWPPVPGATAPGLKVAINDDCAGAIPIGDGTYFGDTSDATPDGEGCFGGSPDVWFAYTSPATAEIVADTLGSGFDTVLSVYTGCPGTFDNEIACNDDTFGLQSAVSFQAQAGVQYLIRVAGCCGDGGATGSFTLNIGPGGVIAGTVSDAVTGEPVAEATLEAYTEDGYYAGHAFTGLAGDYVVPGLSTGTYFLHSSAPGYLPEVYDDLPCSLSQGCDLSSGTPISVTSGTTTDGIDFALHQGGSISGTVTVAATGEPIWHLVVQVWDSQGHEAGYGYTSEEGIYSVSGLSAGSYFATTENGLYRDELYDDIACPGGGFGGGCDPTTGEAIEVAFGATTGGVDFALERFGVITGTVSDSVTGFPIGSLLLVSVWDADGQAVRDAHVDSTGAYEQWGLVTGNYFVTTSSYDHFDELYDDLPCEPDCDPTAGTPVAVTLNSMTPGIDFALERLGAITGTVTHRPTGEPIREADVYIWNELGQEAAYIFTGSAGTYFAAGLRPGNYAASVRELDHRGELYDDLPCPDGACDPTTGTRVAVSLNTVTGGVDFALERLGSISGRVSNGGQPVADAYVTIYDASGNFRRAGFSDPAGNYTVGGLEPGSYFALVDHWQLDNELYDDIPCEDGCDPTSGTPIAVSLDATTAGIDFDLGYCTPTATSLCLTGGRFRVEAAWENLQGAGGPAMAEGLTTDAGTFWFFNPGNIELVVKVLDVCIEPHNRFWVFGAGLTDVGVELTVTDEATGEVRSYANPVGTPYQPVLDTLAFATCDAGFQSAAGGTVAEPPPISSLWQPPLFQTGPAVSRLPASGGTTCVPSATSLCLTSGRFMAELTWEAPNGDGGPAQAVPLTDESGYFWFGGPDNVEVVVKVLDACNLAPFNNYWVFAAGLTNFEIILRVTDTESGEFREYYNPQGTTFQAITDTGAFDTCDP